MLINLFHVVLAFIGIGIIIFFHELGHYWVARRVGMTVEVFSIGFGKVIKKWHRKGVEWRICWIPFGGYVRVAGAELDEKKDPKAVKGGYFAAKPWDRIKFAIAGPVVNVIFSLVLFSFLWVTGGRDKPFSEFTSFIGWVAPDSGASKAGIRPGDEITSINNKSFRGFNDFLYSSLLDDRDLTISGELIDYQTTKKTPYTYIFSPGEEMSGMQRASLALGTLNPAQYLVYDSHPSGGHNPLRENSPLAGSGLVYGDRIIWADGSLIFSNLQLSRVVNSPYVLLGVERAGKTFLTKIPRIQIRDLRISGGEREELDDWRNEAGLGGDVNDLTFIPYNLDNGGKVERALSYVDDDSQIILAYTPSERAPLEIPLLSGDKILSIHGQKITSSYELLKELQTRKVLVAVNRTAEDEKPLSWKEADKGFAASFDIKALDTLARSVALGDLTQDYGILHLLKPISPIPLHTFPLTKAESELQKEKVEKKKVAIEEIDDPKQKEVAEEQLDRYQNRLMLGVFLQDRQVVYNPSPFVLIVDVIKETYQSLYALISGYLSPKVLSGPVGIIQVAQQSWGIGFKEAVFWLGMISLNLGILNLLPIPVLDGGHICFALWEIITGKPLRPKTMERLVIPFLILIIALFVYLTFNDLARIFTQLFK